LLIYEKYILKKLIVVFLLTVVFFTAILFIFNVFRIAKHVAAGLQISLVLKLFFYLVPSLIGFSIPFAALVACLLVYGKLSAQNEILALRASGVSLYRTASAMVMLGVGTFLLAAFVFGVVSPKGKLAVRKLRTELGRINPLFLFEPGETTTISGYSFYLEKKHGNRLTNIRIDHKGKEGIWTHILARSGVMEHQENSRTLSLTLRDVDSRMRKRGGPELWREIAETMVIKFDLASIIERIEMKKEEDEMTFRELLAVARIVRRTGGDVSLYSMELNKRLVFCFACFSFVMIGAPLGMRIRRGEKTIGVSIGLALAMSFYTVVMFAERLRENPSVHPQLLMWLPNAVLIVLGILFFRKVRRGVG
jgi:lipopolysaccharide export system permease protein